MQVINNLRSSSSRSSSSRCILLQTLLGTLVLLLLTTPSVTGFSDMPPQKFYGGAGVGRFTLDSEEYSWKCAYEMVLVERIQGKPKTEGGLFVPTEDMPKLHLCRVISMGPGREEENGRVAPMPEIAVGDYVIAKNPWGIGPKDEETADGKKLSFMRGQDIAGVLDGSFLDEIRGEGNEE